MTIQAQLADGRVLEFPDGTDPQVIQAAVKRVLGQDQTVDQAQPEVIPGQELLSPESRQLPPEQQRAIIAQLQQQQAQAGIAPQPTVAARGAQALEELRATAPAGEAFARALPEIGEAPELNQANTEALRASLAANLITNEAELANALQQIVPNTEVLQDPEGNPLVRFPSGTFAVNKPGLSGQDFAQFTTRLLGFIPASRVVGTGARQLAAGAGAAGATEAGLQATEAALGGEFNPVEVGFAATIQPAAQAIVPALAGVRRFVQSAPTQAQKELIDEGERRGVEILTTDLFPPESFFGRSLQQISEKLGPLGTGSKRRAQQRGRVEAVEELSRNLGLGVDATPQASEIVASLNRGVAKELEQAGQLRGEALFRLDPFGAVPVGRVQEEIGKQIAAQRALRADADPQIIQRLQNLSASINDANFGLLTALRSNLGDDIAAAGRGDALPTKAQAPLRAVQKSLTDAMTSFGRRVDRGATADWLKANRQFAETFGKARNSILTNAIKKGDTTPESISTVIKAGKSSDLRRLSSLLDSQGKSNARAALIRDAIEESGGFREAGQNPDRFITALQRPARQRAINVFFKGENKKQLDGLTRLLQGTRRAQEATAGARTGLGELIPGATVVGIPAGAFVDPFSTFLTVGTVAGAARGFESKAVRDVLVKLSNTKPGSQAEQDIVRGLIPALTAPTQATE